jgi:hypothetical protein
MPKKC